MQDAQIPGIAHGVSCHSTPEVKKAAYEQIWREIDSLEASIRALKSRHNSLSVTARLPPEILSEIFDWTATMLRNNSIRWIRTSFVCSHWRRVALECPNLWRRVDYMSPKQLKALLPRTGAVPLEINFSIVAKWSAIGIMDVLRHRMHRVRELTLGSCTPSVLQNMESVLPCLTQPAPLLEKFSVVSSARRKCSHLPDSLFAGHAPRLRSLELVGCIVPITSPLLTDLTSLKLQGTDHVQHEISLDELMIMLESSPNIQVLELHNAHHFESSGPNGSAPPGRIVHLPHLRHLNIAYDPLTCAALLSRLKYPITITQNITTIHQEHLEFLRSLGAILATRTRPIACIQVRKVPSFGSHKFFFKGWQGTGTSLQPPADVPHIDIQITCRDPSLTPLRAVWQALPMAGLESLYINGKSFSKDAWLDNFGNLSSLKTIRVEGVSPGFLSALNQGLPDCGLENNDAFPFCPKLAGPGRLSFKSLRTLMLGQYPGFPGKMSIQQATALKRCFRDRRKRGAPLRELYISKSLPKNGMEGEITEIFHTVVKEVHWGLHEGGIDSDMEGYILGEISEADYEPEEDSEE